VEVVGRGIVTTIIGFITGRMLWIVRIVKNVSFVMSVWIVRGVMAGHFVRIARTAGIVVCAMTVLDVRIVLDAVGWFVQSIGFLMNRFRKRSTGNLRRIFRRRIS
jgi:hypothetical protein